MRVLVCAILAFAANAFAQTASIKYQPSEADDAAIKELAGVLVTEMSAKCPVRPVNDGAAHRTCREAIFKSGSTLRANLKPYILWGRPPGGDINAVLKDFRATQFGADVFTGTYAPMWMWDGKYDIEYVRRDQAYRITASVGFRNELDFGQYPYPFWQDPRKWTDYEDANTMAIWIDPKTRKIQQFTFYKRGDKPMVAQTTRRHVPTFDGKWMWTDDKGQQQPAPTLFRGLYSDQNPYLAEIDRAYRKFALAMRDAECDSCHVPSNPDKMPHLVLLQTPLHAASEIERVIRNIERDRMPMDDSGIEKPLDPVSKARFLLDAVAFATVLKAARDWESSNEAKQSPNLSGSLVH